MSKTIQKLNKLKNPESFLQINTIRGFKYIDKAGEIVNEYHKKDTAPVFSMNLDGLIIKDPKEKIEELKITPQTIWAKFSEVDSLDSVARMFSLEAERIIKILEVGNISRIGWRNYFIFDFINEEKQNQYFEKIFLIKKSKLNVASFEVTTEKQFKVNLVIQPVIKNDEQKTRGVLFDIDIFQKENITTDNIHNILKTFREYLIDENGFLKVINDTFI